MKGKRETFADWSRTRLRPVARRAAFRLVSIHLTALMASEYRSVCGWSYAPVPGTVPDTDDLSAAALGQWGLLEVPIT